MAGIKKTWHLLSSISMADTIVISCIHCNHFAADGITVSHHHCTEEETASLYKFIQLLNERSKM